MKEAYKCGIIVLNETDGKNRFQYIQS